MHFTKMMALVVDLMKVYKKKVHEEENSGETTGVLSNLLDQQVQEAMSEVVQEAVAERWDRRTFAVTSENPEGGDRVRFTVYSQCETSGDDWAASVGELRASGVRKVEEATSNVGLLTRPSQFSTESFARERRGRQEN